MFEFPPFYRRKSISGNWKTNQGSAMVDVCALLRLRCYYSFLKTYFLQFNLFQLEQITMTEKYKSWVNDVSDGNVKKKTQRKYF